MQFQLADLYEILCDANPDALALIAGDRCLTRGELDARANRLAHHLQIQGIGVGDHVGIYAYNRAEWIESLLACWKIRAVAININFRYTVHELRYIWGNSDIVALIYEAGFAPMVNELAEEFLAITHYLVLDDGSELDNPRGQNYEAALAGQSDRRGFAPRSPDDIYFMYTGGTTGKPKGVLWQQRVAAVVELHAGARDPTLEEIQQACREYIAGYKIPRELIVSKFKRTPNGKIDYVWAKEVAEQAVAKASGPAEGEHP